MSEPYRPSNGTEGEMFMQQFCYRCIKDDYDDALPGSGCGILMNALAYGEGDPEYPKEWVEDDGGPKCTAFERRA